MAHRDRTVVALVGVDTTGDAPGGIATISRSIVDGFKNDPLIDIIQIANFDEGGVLRRLSMGMRAAYQIIEKRNEIDLVHVQVATGWSIQRDLCAVIASWLSRLPVVAQYHGSDQINDFSSGSSAHRLSYRLLIHLCYNVALGTSVLAWLKSVNSRAFSVIVPNGVDVPELPTLFSENFPSIVFVGRLGKRKGTFDLLAAVETLYERGVRFDLDLLGDGDLGAVQERIDASKNLHQCVKVLGWQDEKHVSEALRKAWALALPSYEEGLPMAILEAMASGRAIVGTRVGDVGDLVTDSENGFLVEPGDVEALAGALQSIVGDRALAQKLGMNGYEMCKEHFSSVKMIERLRDLYFEVIKLDQSQRTGLLSQTRRALK